MPAIFITGQKFGRLTVLSRTTQRSNDGHAVWRCRCDCGTEVAILTNNLRSGGTKSCGCLQREERAKMGRAFGPINGLRKRRHGESSSRKQKRSREYRAWQGLKERCRNPRCKAFRHYGGRGISFCERWERYENFLADMGRCPPGLSLDRINNDGNYEPSNCRWATPSEQNNNRRRPRKRAAIIEGGGSCATR